MNATELQTLFENELKPKLEPLEQTRLEAVKRKNICLVLGAILIAASIFWVLATNQEIEVVMFPIVIGGLILGAFFNAKWSVYRKAYKNEVVTALLEFIDPSLTCRPNGYVDSTKYKTSGLYRRSYDRYSGEDHITGKIGKTAIEFSELHTEYKTTSRDSKGRTTTNWHTIFKGIFFIADANKHFNSKTYVLADSQGFFSSIGKALTDKFGGIGDRVALEDVDFEQYFEVYSDDQVEARYLLSPALMRRLVEFRKSAGNVGISLSFVGDNIYIAIPNRKDFFEPKLNKSAVAFDMVEEIFRDLDFFIGVVEDLDLNTRIWTKQ
ncbi:conserved hypothetical protein [Vibrio nigripulchritudo SFn27]|uniref:Galanin n=1 Tax=Vibrio nigripulchritudo TaxID=28173 RepID=U4JZP3_9VIBR|nr:DUF3137 domain-containing protein [Vibrio nigripulchritudo]CCN84900.1 conserved hypothetical protein [Vibrio nigripulchritudo BLFn1]CCN90112.1 conserved hypothetical protein [Vibrio nigripulchritudo SFn27]CCN94275.1 conserved hypothetical protein [Vibrio nigripulchritudo ENn2]CCO42629.1 conserved hypothetical protein [Vibrio nigripulchritudo SFn135]CCO51267.1 conserved hypothetical protein [Vibrio nigripulchritudo Wn13]